MDTCCEFCYCFEILDSTLICQKRLESRGLASWTQSNLYLPFLLSTGYAARYRTSKPPISYFLHSYQSIDLPKTGRSNPISTSETNPPSSSSSTSKNNPKDPSSDPITPGTEKEKLKFDYHDEWLRDEWVEEGLRRAWREWRVSFHSISLWC